MKFLKKNNFTLLEVIISLSLITIIITFLFGFFSKVMKIEKIIEKKKLEILAINQTQIKLTQVFSNVYQGDFINQKPFYTKDVKNPKGPVLYLSYDNKIDSDANFSLIVKAKLFIDNKKNLCLHSFSRDENEKKPREDILLKDVDKIEYNFLAKSDIKLKKHKLNNFSEKICSYNFWPKKAETLPFAIKIKIIKNKDSLDFAFFLPGSHVKM